MINMTNMVSEEQATGITQEVYADIKYTFGLVPNLF